MSSSRIGSWVSRVTGRNKGRPAAQAHGHDDKLKPRPSPREIMADGKTRSINMYPDGTPAFRVGNPLKARSDTTINQNLVSLAAIQNDAALPASVQTSSVIDTENIEHECVSQFAAVWEVVDGNYGVTSAIFVVSKSQFPSGVDVLMAKDYPLRARPKVDHIAPMQGEKSDKQSTEQKIREAEQKAKAKAARDLEERKKKFNTGAGGNPGAPST